MSEVSTPKKETDNIVQFICRIDGWQTKCHNLHFAAPKDNTHVRLDEFIEILKDYKDSLAEDYMGITSRFRPNQIVQIKSEALDALSFIGEVKQYTFQFYESIPKDTAYVGIKSECEAFIHQINKYTYLLRNCDVMRLS